MKKPFFFAIMFVVSVPGFGQGDRILGEEPSINSVNLSPREDSLFGVGVGVMGGLGFTSYSLTSSGYSANLPASPGYLLGLRADYEFAEAPVSLELAYINQAVNFTKVAGASPSEISMTTHLFEGVVNYELNYQWSIGVGASVRRRYVTQTSPRDVVSSANTAGPLIKTTYELMVSTKDTFGAYLLLYLPNRYEETPTNSGYANFSYNARLVPHYRREFKPNVYGGIGLWLEYEYNAFAGTGTRLTTDARERFWRLFLPISLEMEF